MFIIIRMGHIFALPQQEVTSDVSQMTSWERHVRGTIVGNCAGDAIGLSTEFMTKAEAQVRARDISFTLQIISLLVCCARAYKRQQN